MAERLSKPPDTPQTILVVDDVDGVLSLVVDILEMENFHVLQAGGGAQALQIAAGYPGKIDMLLSDVKMPGISGPQLGEALKKVRPDIQVLLMSGYCGAELRTRRNGWPLIEKPFPPGKLLEMIQDVLHPPNRSSGSRGFDTRNLSVTSA